MKRILAIILILLALFACYDAVSAQRPVQLVLIQREYFPSNTTVYAVYDIPLGSDYPTFRTENGIANVVLARDDNGWRGRIAVWLDRCNGALFLNEGVVIQQRCTRFPVVVK